MALPYEPSMLEGAGSAPMPFGATEGGRRRSRRHSRRRHHYGYGAEEAVMGGQTMEEMTAGQME